MTITLKDHIYTLQISIDHPRSLTLPYIFSSTSPLTFLSFGTRNTTCENIEIHYTYAHEIIIGEQIAKELYLPFPTTVHAFIQNQTLVFGPLIGIFTTGFTESAANPIGNRSISFKELLTPPHSLHPFVFLFGAQHMNWDEETIDGYFLKRKTGYNVKFLFQTLFMIGYLIEKQNFTNLFSEQKNDYKRSTPFHGSTQVFLTNGIYTSCLQMKKQSLLCYLKQKHFSTSSK